MFYVVCPYDYYQLGPERDMLLNKLQESRTDSPICGTVALDNQGSMQGLWYEASYTNEETQQANEADHIALVPSNTEPQTTGVLSIGNTQLNSDGYYFDYLETGRLNRRFSEATTHNQTYCWGRFRNRETRITGSYQPIDGHFFAQLTSDDRLIIEPLSDGECPENEDDWLLTNNAIAFTR